MRFLVVVLPEVQNQIRKGFTHKVLYNYKTIFLPERFGQYLKMSKMEFLLYYQIFNRQGGLFF